MLVDGEASWKRYKPLEADAVNNKQQTTIAALMIPNWHLAMVEMVVLLDGLLLAFVDVVRVFE